MKINQDRLHLEIVPGVKAKMLDLWSCSSKRSNPQSRPNGPWWPKHQNINQMYLSTIRKDILLCWRQRHNWPCPWCSKCQRSRVDWFCGWQVSGDWQVLVASFAHGAGMAHGYKLPLFNTVLEKLEEMPIVGCVGFQRISTIFQSCWLEPAAPSVSGWGFR